MHCVFSISHTSNFIVVPTRFLTNAIKGDMSPWPYHTDRSPDFGSPLSRMAAWGTVKLPALPLVLPSCTIFMAIAAPRPPQSAVQRRLD